MKKKALFSAILLMLCAFTLVAFRVNADTSNGNKNKTEKKLTNENNKEQNLAMPCACSNFQCSMGHTLTFSARAYKEYTGKRCRCCNGNGQSSSNKICRCCDGEGLEWIWKSGCVCNKCGEVYVQPNNC